MKGLVQVCSSDLLKQRMLRSELASQKNTLEPSRYEWVEAVSGETFLRKDFAIYSQLRLALLL